MLTFPARDITSELRFFAPIITQYPFLTIIVLLMHFDSSTELHSDNQEDINITIMKRLSSPMTQRTRWNEYSCAVHCLLMLDYSEWR